MEEYAINVNASAESPLHSYIYKTFQPQVVLHVHSIWNTLVSLKYLPTDYLELTNFEVLKALPGVTTHEESLFLWCQTRK